MTPESPNEFSALVEAFFALQPWQHVEDQIIGLRGNCGLRFASIMGSGGREFGALLLKVWEGYSILRGIVEGEGDADTMQSAKLLSLSIEHPEDYPPQFAAYAKRRGLHAVKGMGQPLVMVKTPRMVAKTPTAADEALLCESLAALVELARGNRLKLARRRLRARQALVFEREKTGAWQPTWVVIPPEPALPPVEQLTQADRTVCQTLPRLQSRYLAAFHAGGLSIRGEIPRLLVVLDEATDKVLDTRVLREHPKMSRDLLTALLRVFQGQNAVKQSGLPQALLTNSKLLYDFIKRDISRLGIRVVYNRQVPHLEFVLQDFFRFLDRRPQYGRAHG